MKSPDEFDLYQFHHYQDGNILLSYKGPYDEYMLFSIGNYIKKTTEKDPCASKKVFKIFMELAQNVSLHSAEFSQLDKEKEVGIGSMVILENEGEYHVFTGNIVKNIDIFPIMDKCNVINALKREELREYKRKQRNNPYSEKGGGNIGLIQVALSSESPLDIRLTQIDEEYSFFSVRVVIENNNKK